MRKVVANADVAGRARYAEGGLVEKLPPKLDVAEAFKQLEEAVRSIPVPHLDVTPLLAAVQASRDAVLAAIAAANRPRKFTMHHVHNDKGRIVDTIVTEE